MVTVEQYREAELYYNVHGVYPDWYLQLLQAELTNAGSSMSCTDYSFMYQCIYGATEPNGNGDTVVAAGLASMVLNLMKILAGASGPLAQIVAALTVEQVAEWIGLRS